MKFPSRFLLLMCLAITLTACQGTAARPAGVSTSLAAEAGVPPQATETRNVPTRENPGEAAPSPAITTAPPVSTTPAPTPRVEESRSERTQYHLFATFDYGLHHLAVEERIVYPNRSGEAIPDLLLAVEPRRYPEVFRLLSLSWGDGSPVEDYELGVGTLHIPLPDPLPPGESLEIFLFYELNLPSPSPSDYGRPVPFGYSVRQTNLVDWYPFLPPYIPGEGWHANQAGYFGEHQVYETADFRVRIRLEGARRDITIAASAPAEQDGEEYVYEHRAARNFAWSASDQYLVLSKTAGDTTVTSYAFPLSAGAGEAALQATVDALELYGELFGPYPHPALAVVEADFLDGMEYDGLFFLSKGFYNSFTGVQADYLIAIAAHETAHQWWYGLVGNDQANEPWLDEALATYAERLYYERYDPKALDWWWTYRIYYYQPAGPVDGSIYNPHGYRAYRDAVYLNGALFLEDLRERAGEEAFFSFLQDYAAKYAYRVASAEEFFALLEEHSQEDFKPILSEYFSEP